MILLKNSKYVHPQILIRKITGYTKNPSRIFKHAREIKQNKKLENQFVEIFFDNYEEYNSYKQELLNTGLIKDLYKLRNDFGKSVKGKNQKGKAYSMGAVNTPVGIRMYCLIRKYKPEILIETGVANGVSSTFILKAIYKNQTGKLYSIDFPEIEGKHYKEGELWEGKKGSVIPKDKTSGWVVPDYLKKNWELFLGKSQDKLPEILEKIPKVDFFIHDSEHTYDCMMFEFDKAYAKLSENGLILTDNVHSNNSFKDFCEKHDFVPFNFNKNTSIAIDPNRFDISSGEMT